MWSLEAVNELGPGHHAPAPGTPGDGESVGETGGGARRRPPRRGRPAAARREGGARRETAAGPEQAPVRAAPPARGSGGGVRRNREEFSGDQIEVTIAIDRFGTSDFSLGPPSAQFPKRTVMPLGRGTRPHENGSHRVYPGGTRPGARPSSLWCLGPGDEPGPDRDRRHVGPDPVAPGPPGEHAEQTARCAEVAPGPRPSPSRDHSGATPMDLIHRCGAGLDVHKETVVACIRRADPDGQAHCQVRTFGTRTAELLALGDWLEAAGVRHVAMGSTGVYWEPIGTCWGIASRRCWSTPAPSSRSPAARPASRAPRGSRGCWRTACWRPASCRRRRSAPARPDAAADGAGPRPRRGRRPGAGGAGGGRHQAGRRRRRRVGVSGRAMIRALIAGREGPVRWPSWRGSGCGARSPG